MSVELEKRIRDKSLLKLICEPGDLIGHFAKTSERTLNLGWSGFTPVGYPKVVPLCIADYVEKNNLSGKWKFNLYIGASVGAECEDRWAELGLIDKRWAYQTGVIVNKSVNNGSIRFGDKHVSLFAQDLVYGFYTPEIGGKLDIAIIEASAITEDGHIVPTGSVGASPEIIQIADKIIVEINTSFNSLEGIHDIVLADLPPNKKVIPITKTADRIGTTYMPTDKSKIIGIVESKLRDNGRALRDMDSSSQKIAELIIDFLTCEVKAGRIPKNLLPLQSGVGAIANAVVGGLISSPFTDLDAYSEVLQDTFLDFLDSKKCRFVSCTSLSLSDEGFEHWWKNYNFYKERVLLRPMRITNNPEVIRRLGVIAMNTPVEFDIYAHANSSLVGGVRMLNGIGGSGDFLRSAYLSIMHTPSVRAGKTDEFGVSCVVPMVSHVDHTEHDLDILVTDQGLADLRGVSPKDRARLIINKCAHPAYKDYLNDYFERAAIFTKNSHEPQILGEVFKLHESLRENGTMRYWLDR
jgi:acetyl-CoA hydrolase